MTNRILVAGDGCIDTWWHCTLTKMIAEGPSYIPVYKVKPSEAKRGYGSVVLEMAEVLSPDLEIISLCPEGHDKIRFCIANTPITRFDVHFEDPEKVQADVPADMISNMIKSGNASGTVDYVVIYDKGQGAINPKIVPELVEKFPETIFLVEPYVKWCQEEQEPTLMDKLLDYLPDDLEPRSNLIIKTNYHPDILDMLKETSYYVVSDGPALVRYRLPWGEGVILPPEVTVVDPCGCGDQLLAGMCVFGIDSPKGLQRSVVAASIQATHRECTPVSMEEVERFRPRMFAKDKIVLTWGIFDGLHYGHEHLIRSCKKLPSYLVVAVDTARKAKQSGKEPYYNHNQRRGFVQSLGLADEVVAHIDTERLITQIQPDLVVKADQITPEESKILERYGIPFVLLPKLGDVSSSKIKEMAGLS